MVSDSKDNNSKQVSKQEKRVLLLLSIPENGSPQLKEILKILESKGVTIKEKYELVD